MNHMKLLQTTITDFVSEYQRNVFNFLFERDLQSLLFSTAYRHFADESIRMRGGYHGKSAYGGEDYIDTIPIKCEYPTSQVFDIALIDPDTIMHYDKALYEQNNWKNDKFWDQPVCAAIELKYYQLGDSYSRKVWEVEKDVAKLTVYHKRRGDTQRSFLGIALICIQTEQLKSSGFCVGTTLESSVSFPKTGIYRYIVTPSSVTKYIA